MVHMEHIGNVSQYVVEHPDMGIVMPDGCRLSSRTWLPADADENPVPVILEFLPYRKRDGTSARDSLTHPWFARHGYACLRVDMRGNGDSEGLMEDEYTQQELEDACQVISWAASQSWCNGRVGMMGISWGGFNGLQVAMLRPPALKAVVTLSSTVDRFADDIHYKGGCLLNANFSWAATMLSYSSRPPDPELVGDTWRDMWLNRLEAQPFLASVWLRNQDRNAYWQHGSACEDYDSIEAAVLSIGGWHDGYRNTISHLVSNLGAPVKGIVGPWNHKYPHIASPEPRIGFLQEAKRWWDRWLKEEDTGVEEDPAYRAWLMDAIEPVRKVTERPGRWVAENEWPSSRIERHCLHLGPGETLGDDSEKIHASITSPPGSGQDSGTFFPFNYGPEMPDVQNGDDANSLCFSGQPLTEPVDIVGAPVFTFSGSVDKPLALIAIRLCDVAPDGTSALITMGLLNLAHLSSAENPQPLEPGKVFEGSLVLDQIAYRVPEGHRLQIAVSTDYWPFIWPSPERVCLTLETGMIDIPLRPLADGDEWAFEAPQGANPWNIEVLRASSSSRRMETNPETGETVTIIDNDFGAQKDLDVDLLSGSKSTERWSIRADDPLSAKGEITWEQTGGREGWLWRSESKTFMSCDRKDFHITAELKVFLNDEVFFSKTFKDRIDRFFV